MTTMELIIIMAFAVVFAEAGVGGESERHLVKGTFKISTDDQEHIDQKLQNMMNRFALYMEEHISCIDIWDTVRAQVGYGTKSFEVDKISLDFNHPGKTTLVIDKNAADKRSGISNGTTMEISMHYDAAKAKAAKKIEDEANERQAKFEAEYKAKQKATQDAADKINQHNRGDLKSVKVEWKKDGVEANIAPIKISEETTTAGVWLTATVRFGKSRLKEVSLHIPGKEPITIDESTANTEVTLEIPENTTMIIVAWHDPQPIISGTRHFLAFPRS